MYAVLLELSPEDMPLKLPRPDGRMVLQWSDKAIEKLKALQQEASRNKVGTANNEGSTTGKEDSTTDEEATANKGGG